MSLKKSLLFLAAICVTAVVIAHGAERFPPPDFGPGYEYPVLKEPPARSGGWAWVDMAVLAIALALAARFAIYRRSRAGLVGVTLFSLAYFGFFRQGCVCPIGATQNVAQALVQSDFVLPLVVLVFFFAPLFLALFCGRVFCAGVCPLGAVQELVLLKPIHLPRWLSDGLGLFRYVYLALAVLLATMGAVYIICLYDPFVGFFRMQARFHIWVLSASFLGLSLFIGRPYCRFLCPYGALLGLVSRFSLRRVTITPDRCVVCGLCRDACPYGALREADSPETIAERESAIDGRRLSRAGFWLAVIVVFMVAGWALGRYAAPALARQHYIVQVAEHIYHDERVAEDIFDLDKQTFHSQAFRETGQPSHFIYDQAEEIVAAFRLASPWMGLFLGLVFALALCSIAYPRIRREYEADPALCVACGRCYMSCPVEHQRRKQEVRF